MRFGLALCLTLAIGVTANAAPWDIVPTSKAGTSQSVSPKLSMQRGGSSNALQTVDGLSLAQFAKSLGKISAMAVSETGTVYTADYKTGRIWVLSDRGQDGSLDMRRPLPQTFNNPTGLAVIGETLYVADKQAVWALEPNAEPRILAPLSNSQSQGIFSLIAEDNSLILGITKAESSLIVRIDTATGRAEKIAELPSPSPIHALSKRKGAPLWVATGNTLQSIDSPQTALHFSEQRITSLALPGQFTAPANWPAAMKDAIIASQIGPKAMRLIAVPTEFGQPAGEARVLVDGYLSGSGRSAWGQPGAIVMDARGVFFADSYNGTVWRLSAMPKKEEPKPAQTQLKEIEKIVETKPKKSPLLIGSGIKGSQIGEASNLGPASQLKTGSTIIDAYEKAEAEAQAEKEALKEKEKPSKKSRSKR